MYAEDQADVLVRRARREDAAAIAFVLRESFAEYTDRYTPAALAATAPTEEEVHVRMIEGPVWVAERAGLIVGTASAVVESTGVYIRGMATAPPARGRGIGQLLLEEIEVFALTVSLYRLYQSTPPFLEPAIRLYEQAGFHRIADGPHDLHGTPVFTMEKILRPSDLE
ncbi:MAG: GNAT family N-acetyltransferase [Planctomycetes bacterium]|nr:GNAT family N-acetyltransferase [Planctomycetota bacterium]